MVQSVVASNHSILSTHYEAWSIGHRVKDNIWSVGRMVPQRGFIRRYSKGPIVCRINSAETETIRPTPNPVTVHLLLFTT